MVVELVLSSLAVLVGAVMTTVGAFSHGGLLIAPGAALILFGAAWLGNVLARRDVRLFPSTTRSSDETA